MNQKLPNDLILALGSDSGFVRSRNTIRLSSPVLTVLTVLLLLDAPARAQTLSDPSLSIDSGFSVTGLSAPTTMAFLSPNEILVLQKGDGRVRYVVSGALQGAPVLDVNVNDASERGLLGIAINTENPPGVFLFYTEADGSDGGTPLGNRVYRYDWNDLTQQLENPQLILDLPVLPGANHDGGIVLLGPTGEAPGFGDGSLLYAVIGDLNRNGQLENFPAGAMPDDTAVILRVRQDGSAAPGNPFTPYCSITTTQTCPGGGGCPGGETCVSEVAKYYAYGVRNSFGMALDPLTGNLWNTENGPGSNDEVNRVPAGFNSGWEQIMGLDANDPQDPGDLFDMPGVGSTYSDPEFTWFDTNAPTAIVFPFGSSLGPAYNDVAVVGDNNSGQLFRFPLDAARAAFDFSAFPALQDLVANDNSERDLLSIGTGFGVITDLEIGPDGALYVVSLSGGSITRIIGPGQPMVPAFGYAGILLLVVILALAPWFATGRILTGRKSRRAE